jgi:outer membrane lipoprotein
MRDQADKGVTHEALFQNPDEFAGRIVILGGFIVDTEIKDEGSYIEVVQNPLDSTGRPEDRDISSGRFLVFVEGHIDTAIYSAGREITVAGEVLGRKVLPLGEAQYPYLLIKGKELHLIKQREDFPLHFGIGIWGSF